MGGASKQLSYTLLPPLPPLSLPIVHRRNSCGPTCLSAVNGQGPNIEYQIFSSKSKACGKYFGGFSVCPGPADPIFYSPDVLSRIGGVAIGLAGRDHFNTRSRYKFRSQRVVA